jgi:hypothetical protein
MRKITIIMLLFAVLCFLSSCTYSADYNRLLNEYNNLVNDYNELRATHNELVDKYNKLATQFEGATVPPYLLVKGREIKLVFRKLDGSVMGWKWEVETLEASVILGRFMRALDLSALNYLGLNDVANRFKGGSKYVQLEGQGTYIDCRPYIKEDNFELIASELFSLHTNDESRVREVWNMVTQLNTYSQEMTETPRLPLETLLFGGGDCDDLAILTASILKAMSPEWKVSLVYMDSDNATSLNKVNHVTVHVDTGEYETFVESTKGDIMCPWNEVDGFYLEIQ